MHNLKLVLSALIKNKYRFASDAKKSKKIGFIVLIAFAYIMIVSYAILITVGAGSIMDRLGVAELFYVALLLMGGVFVLVFGIIHLISTLFMSKDSQFFAALPIKPVTVFSAKLLFVYLSEAVIAIAVLLPAVIGYGITVHAWYGYYIISILMMFIIPALPLALAAIIALPVMLIASRLKHSSVLPLVFYCLLFVGFFAAYIYLVYSANMDEISEEGVEAFAKAIQNVMYAVYPYLALSRAAFGIDNFGIGTAGSVAANLGIFIGISFVLFAILILLGKVIYGKAYAMNSREDSGKAKNASYKSASGFSALIKREYAVAMRTTSTAFQCFSVLLLNVIMAVLMSMMLKSSFADSSEIAIDTKLTVFIVMATVIMILPTASNAAATSFSREGTALASLKVLPITIGEILKAKLSAWGSLSAVSALIAAIVINAFDFDIILFIFSVIGITALSFALSVFGALWDLRSPKLKWTDPKDAIKHNTNVTICQIVCMLLGIPFIIVATVFMALGVAFSVATAIFVTILYIYLICMIVVDIIFYKKTEYYYNRIEL